MNKEFWLERWAQGQIGFHQAEINPYLRQYWSVLNVAADSTVFVPMCGKSMDMRWLHDRGHGVVGVEVSQAAIREFFAENALEPVVSSTARFEVWESGRIRLLCGDYFDLVPSDLRGVAAVFDRASLVAMPRATRPGYVETLLQIAPKESPILLIGLTYAQEDMKGPPFAVTEPEVRSLFSQAKVEVLASLDVLDANPRFRERGLAALTEQVYLIRK